MKKLCTASMAALLIATGGTAFAQSETGMQMSQAECQNIWSRADSAGSGTLTPAQADEFVSNFAAADADGDGALNSSEFLAACQQGLVSDSSATGAGEGTQGTDEALPAPSGSPSEY